MPPPKHNFEKFIERSSLDDAGKVDLQTGTKLVWKWRGKTYEVLVRDDGREFEFRGEVYRSLTPIAKKITSAH